MLRALRMKCKYFGRTCLLRVQVS